MAAVSGGKKGHKDSLPPIAAADPAVQGELFLSAPLVLTCP